MQNVLAARLLRFRFDGRAPCAVGFALSCIAQSKTNVRFI
jgi:hypothetical protein